MITDIFLYIIGVLISTMTYLLSFLSPASGIVWPPKILSAFQSFGSSLASINFFLDTYDLALAVSFFIQFLTYYFSSILIIFIIKTIRGN
jgi:hypothetical protein